MQVSYVDRTKRVGRCLIAAAILLVSVVVASGATTAKPRGGASAEVWAAELGAWGPAEAVAQGEPVATGDGAAVPVTAGVPGQGRPMGFMETISSLLPMFAMVYLIFYFLVTRPQQQKLQTHAKLLEELKKGEQVLTTGGLIGRVVSRESDHVVLDIGGGARVKVDPAALSRRWEPAKTDGEKEKADGKAYGGRDAQAKNS